MLTNNIKKGTPIKTNQLGVVVSGTMEDNKKGNTRLIKTNGSEIGLYDEYGSIYAWNIVSAKNEDGSWETIELTKQQTEAQKLNEAFGF